MSQNAVAVMIPSVAPSPDRPHHPSRHRWRPVLGSVLALGAASAARAGAPDHPAALQRLARLEAPTTHHAHDAAASRPGVNPCLGLLADDPAAALDYAQDWSRHGGGSDAAQCAALSTLAVGNPADAAASLDGLARQPGLRPVQRAALADQAAQAWMLAAKPDRALLAARIASDLAPGDPDLLVDRARAANAAGQPAEAITVLGAMLAAHPARADALVIRAGAYRALDRMAQAHADIEAACAAAPDAPDALLERGVVRERLGDLDGARQDWTRILSVSPDGREADLAQQDLALLDAGPEAR